MWAGIAKAVLGFFANLLTLWLVRQGGRDDERADNAEKTLETVERVTAPVSDDERERLWAQNVAKFGRRVRDDSGT